MRQLNPECQLSRDLSVAGGGVGFGEARLPHAPLLLRGLHPRSRVHGARLQRSMITMIPYQLLPCPVSYYYASG